MLEGITALLYSVTNVSSHPHLRQPVGHETLHTCIQSDQLKLFTDLWFWFLHAGKKVVVLENRVRGAGQSGRDTGELSTWNNHHYSRFQQEMGAKAASQIAQSQLDAIALVRGIVKAEGIPCDLNGVPTYLTSSERGLAAEAQAYHVTGDKAEQVHAVQDNKCGRETKSASCDVRDCKTLEGPSLGKGAVECLHVCAACSTRDVVTARRHSRPAMTAVICDPIASLTKQPPVSS